MHTGRPDGSEDPAAPLPFEVSCASALDRSIIDPARLPRGRIARISRLAVHRDYRRRRGEEHTAVHIDSSDFAGERPRFPFVPTSLLLGAVALADCCGIDTMFVLTERAWLRISPSSGSRVIQVGQPIEHRGRRIPSVMHVEEIIRNMLLYERKSGADSTRPDEARANRACQPRMPASGFASPRR